AHDPGPTVLFSGTVDTGFFTFFVRKHDPARRLVVLRSDKIFTTAYLAQESVEERIERPEQIDALLHAFGVKFVVLEDRPFASRALEWLRAKLHSPQFIERVRIPIGTSDRRLKDVSLAVYEFTEATPPAVDAVLSIHLPLAQRNVDARLQDLIDRKYLK